MLRTVVIAVAAMLTCVGIGLIACGVHVPGWQALVLGTLVLVGTLFERWRYRGVEEPTNCNWQHTGEQFVDPSTGEAVEVLFNPCTGERRYVAAAAKSTDAPR